MEEKYTVRNYSLWAGEGILAGAFAGLTIAVYRFCLRAAEEGLATVWQFLRGNPLYIALWFAALLLLAVITGGMMRIEGKAGGSGLPQLASEVRGGMDPCWWRVILVKIPAASLGTLAGLSLGRTGPSIHLGAMAAKGISHIPGGGRQTRESRLRLLCCGAGAGLAATLHVPLAGLLFTLEQLRRGFDLAYVVTGMAATVSADIVTRIFFGSAAAFPYQAGSIPVEKYWLLVLLGVVLGLAGGVYNFSIANMQRMFKRFQKVPQEIKFMVPFLLAGVFGIVLPEVLGGGQPMVLLLVKTSPALSVMAGLLIVKFIFSVICTGSGAPGGIFTPMFVMGAYMGAIFGSLAVQYCGVEPSLWQSFIILGMAGFFAGIFRLPLTGIAMGVEIIGSIQGLPDILLVCLVAFAVGNLTRTKSIIAEMLSVAEETV